MEHLKVGKNVKYGLLYKPSNTLVQYEVASNVSSDSEFSSDTRHDLVTKFGEAEWLVDTKIHVEFVRNHSTKWYNSSHSTPTHTFKKEDLEVVEVEIVVNLTPVQVSLPTPEEYFSHKIKKDPGYEYIFSKWKEEKEAGREIPAYDYWALKLYIMDQEADKEKK